MPTSAWGLPSPRIVLTAAGLLVAAAAGPRYGWETALYLLLVAGLVLPETVRLIKTLRPGGEDELAIVNALGAAAVCAGVVLLPIMIDHARRETDQGPERVQYAVYIWGTVLLLAVAGWHTIHHRRRIRREDVALR